MTSLSTHRQQGGRARLIDAAVLVVCVAIMLVDLAWTPGPKVNAGAIGMILVATGPVLIRRQSPALAFALAMALLVGTLTFAGIYNAVAVPAMVCGYTLASARGRTAALIAAAVTMPMVLVLLQIYSPHPFLDWDTPKNLAFVALPLALGVAAHDRRAYTSALMQRAESAERGREEEALRRVGEERLRIARDVHDVVAHAMVAINVQAGVGAHLLDRDPERARSTLRDIKAVSGTALADLRSMLGLLRDDTDGDDDDHPEVAPARPTTGMSDLEDLRDSLGAAGVGLEVDVDPAVAEVPAMVGATGYRIVQEALTNVMRHVGPTSARVRIRRGEAAVVIEVDNDPGSGPTPLNGTGSGHGLRGMRERAAAVGGSLEAGPRPDGGWRVAASLPVDAP